MGQPRTSYAVTVYVGCLILLCWVVSFVVQSLVGLLLCPLLVFEGGRERFQCIESFIWRNLNALIVVGLNPFWSVRLIDLSEETAATSDGLGKVIFANHRSNADPWIAAQVQLMMCSEAKYIYKSSLGKIPFAGCCLRLSGDLSAEFGNRESIADMLDRARELLEAGYNVFVFPEGTRSPSGLLQNFKPTFFNICAELGCSAVPLVFLGSERAWPAKGFRMGCATVTGVFGKPLTPGPGGGEQLSKDVEAAFRAMAADALDEGLVERDDPLLTDRPYPWWDTPEEFASLGEQEQLSLLRAGKMHERGKSIA